MECAASYRTKPSRKSGPCSVGCTRACECAVYDRIIVDRDNGIARALTDSAAVVLVVRGRTGPVLNVAIRKRVEDVIAAVENRAILHVGAVQMSLENDRVKCVVRRFCGC